MASRQEKAAESTTLLPDLVRVFSQPQSLVPWVSSSNPVEVLLKGLLQNVLIRSPVGFEFVKAPDEIVVLDTRGRVVGTAQQATPSGHGRLTIGNKTLPDSILG